MLSFFNFGAICDGLESGIYGRKENIKIYFEIGLMDPLTASDDIQKIFVSVSRICGELKSSEIAHFMLICEVIGDEMEEYEQDWNAQKYQFMNEESKNYEIRTEDHVIIVTNKQCQIAGYHESWLMSQ